MCYLELYCLFSTYFDSILELWYLLDFCDNSLPKPSNGLMFKFEKRKDK